MKEFPFVMAIALRLGAGFLCEDEPGAETLELTVSRFLTPIGATHVSIITSDISCPAPARPSTINRTFRYRGMCLSSDLLRAQRGPSLEHTTRAFGR